MGANFAPSPVFEFIVYRVYRMRDSKECFCLAFRVYTTGFLFAKHIADSHEEQENESELFSKNLVTSWFYCCKRMGAMSASEEKKGSVEFIGKHKLNEKQMAYFVKNRMQY